MGTVAVKPRPRKRTCSRVEAFAGTCSTDSRVTFEPAETVLSVLSRSTTRSVNWRWPLSMNGAWTEPLSVPS